MRWQQDTEDVFGLSVNRGMATTARRILLLHLTFIVMYGISGVVQIFATEVVPPPPQGLSGESFRQYSGTSGGLGSVLAYLVFPILIYICVRYAIKHDYLEVLTSTAFLDGCASATNCYQGVCGLLALLWLSSVMGMLEDRPDICACPKERHAPSRVLCRDEDRADVCSTCFDPERCEESVQAFKDYVGPARIILLIVTVTACAQMLCCLCATMYLCQAVGQMSACPFCNRPQTPTAWGGPPILGAPADVVVGRPVQGTPATHVQAEVVGQPVGRETSRGMA